MNIKEGCADATTAVHTVVSPSAVPVSENHDIGGHVGGNDQSYLQLRIKINYTTNYPVVVNTALMIQ